MKKQKTSEHPVIFLEGGLRFKKDQSLMLWSRVPESVFFFKSPELETGASRKDPYFLVDVVESSPELGLVTAETNLLVGGLCASPGFSHCR